MRQAGTHEDQEAAVGVDAFRRVVRTGPLVAAVVLGACLTACVSGPPTRDSSRPGSSSQPSGSSSGSRDIVTASDESEASKRGRLRLELATRYFAQGQMTTALDEVKQSLAADPRQAAAYNLRGLIYQNMNETALADESFRRALQIQPNDADTLHNYGWFLCMGRRYPEAQAQFSSALAVPQYRQRSKTQMASGVCQALSGQLAAAEQALLKAFEMEPGNPTIAMNLADVLYRRGDYQRARFYVGRVNDVRELANPESLWLAMRIENKLGNKLGVANFGGQLRARYPASREALRYEKGQFDD